MFFIFYFAVIPNFWDVWGDQSQPRWVCCVCLLRSRRGSAHHQLPSNYHLSTWLHESTPIYFSCKLDWLRHISLSVEAPCLCLLSSSWFSRSAEEDFIWLNCLSLSWPRPHRLKWQSVMWNYKNNSSRRRSCLRSTSLSKMSKNNAFYRFVTLDYCKMLLLYKH